MKKVLGLFVLTFVMSCSCQQGRGTVDSVCPSSGLTIECQGRNCLPLESCDITDCPGGRLVRYKVFSQDCLCHYDPILVCTEPDVWNVTVNGIPVTPDRSRHLLSGNDVCFAIADIVRDGENTVELCGNGEAVPVYVLGDFGVFPSDGSGWCITPPVPLELGSLASQGFPFYSGEVAYVREFEVPDKVGRRILRIDGWAGSGCEVLVNGYKVADAHFKTFRKNIGPFLSPGQNYVEVRISGPAGGKSAPGDFGMYEEFTIE